MQGGQFGVGEADEVAEAVAVAASEVFYGCAVLAEGLGGLALLCFGCFSPEHLGDGCIWAVEEIVDVPEEVFFFFEVALHAFFQVGLGGAYVGVVTFWEGGFFEFADVQCGFCC